MDLTTFVEDKFHKHEILDRLHVINCNIDDFLLNHPSVQTREHIKVKIEEAQKILSDCYQEVGQEN